MKESEKNLLPQALGLRELRELIIDSREQQTTTQNEGDKR